VSEDLRPRLAGLLATVLERDAQSVAALADDQPLFGGGLGLDSLSGVRLLAMIQAEFGVDIATEDLALESLESVGTLSRFLAERI
jgi:acyl carrier protein